MLESLQFALANICRRLCDSCDTTIYGQGADWVRMNFTNAEEILSVGYADWVDDQIFLDPCGYRFTVSVTNTQTAPVRLTVGDLSVVATNAGDYVFLLRNGVEYPVGHSPLPEGCGLAYSWTGSEDYPLSQRSGAGQVIGETWTALTPDAFVDFWPPDLFGAYGFVIRHPKLTITPDRLVNPSYPVTFTANVVVVKKEGDAVTLAHEIGHSLGLCDIYVSNDEAENNLLPADVKSVKFETVRREFLSDDWNGGCGLAGNGRGNGGARYYPAGMKIGDLIPRLLMYGIYTGTKRDLSLGGIDGVWYEWVGDRKSWQKGETPIGTASPSQFNVHRTHQ